MRTSYHRRRVVTPKKHTVLLVQPKCNDFDPSNYRDRPKLFRVVTSMTYDTLGEADSKISSRRHRIGVKAFPASAIDWSLVDPLLGTMSDAELSRTLNINLNAITSRRCRQGIDAFNTIDWNAIDHLLGTASDQDIASRFGVTRQTIRKRRNKTSVPAFISLDWSKVDPILGKKNDREIAEEFGVSQASIRKRRAKLGIPSFRTRC